MLGLKGLKGARVELSALCAGDGRDGGGGDCGRSGGGGLEVTQLTLS